MKFFITLIFVLSSFSLAEAKLYQCPVSEKYDAGGNVYTQEMIDKYKYSVNVLDMGETAILERCSYSSSEGKVTCDRYEVDYIQRDDYVDTVKYYYFSGQFDVQIINDSLFIENNGRGGIAFGNCEDKS